VDAVDVTSLLEQASYLAHGYCLLWQPWLVALHAVPDLLIFLAYTSIPIAAIPLLRMRQDLQEFRGLIGLFAAFILLCGLSHLVGLLTLWFPVYPVHGVIKSVTAVVSIVTAIAFVPLVPKLIKLPSPAHKRALDAQIQAEVEAHEETLRQLAESHKSLSSRVERRTAELSQSNERLRILARETVHRGNNLLAQIQSLANQCARETEDGSNWLEAFDKRVAALGRGNAAVLKYPKSLTANIVSIVAGELAPLSPEIRNRIVVDGPDFQVRHEAAQQFALLLWELIHQSSRLGALSRTRGEASIEWKTDGDTLTVEWTETDGAAWIADLAPTSLPARLLFQSAPIGLGGTVRALAVADAGYRIDVPIAALQPQDRADAADMIFQAYPRTPSMLAKPVQAE